MEHLPTALYPGTEHPINKDTDTVLARDFRKQATLRHRSVARCDQVCGVRAQEHVKRLRRGGGAHAEGWRATRSCVHERCRRSTTSAEQKEITRGNEQQASFTKEHVVKVGAEPQNLLWRHPCFHGQVWAQGTFTGRSRDTRPRGCCSEFSAAELLKGLDINSSSDWRPHRDTSDFQCHSDTVQLHSATVRRVSSNIFSTPDHVAAGIAESGSDMVLAMKRRDAPRTLVAYRADDQRYSRGPTRPLGRRSRTSRPSPKTAGPSARPSQERHKHSTAQDVIGC